MENLVQKVKTAGEAGDVLASTVENVTAWLEGGFLPAWAEASLAELIEDGHWSELNDRFYKALEFGTGGMRSRTIGRVVAAAEKGTPGPLGTPEHAAVGTAMLNDFNIVRATIGLYRYAARHLEKKHGRAEAPRIVIAHDVRHFSRHFCELAASVWMQLGGQAFIFDGPRSTPQLSFSVRYLGATAGVVITASHNPSHDNGFKVYFEDGAQVVYPHAEGIIHEVYQVGLGETPAFFGQPIDRVVTLGEAADQAYRAALRENVLDAAVFQKASPKIVFTAIHGVGGVTAPAMLRELGLEVEEVAEQAKQDPRFPTVKSPNPENAEALAMAIAQARETGRDIVIATDPDADRMGVAVRRPDGEFALLTGNQTGALLAAYRIQKMKDLGQLPANGTSRAALIKTFVTTKLQNAIGEQHGLKVIDTLTGFKWIGEKIRGYEEAMKAAFLEDTGIALDYDATPTAKRRELLLKYATYYVFGNEESYGYLGNDRVRDKDANAAVVMFAEMAADLAAQGKGILDYLDDVYLRFGYFDESMINLYYEGAAGAQKIANILESYREDPPKVLGDLRVTRFQDFGTQTIHDADGKVIPKQDFYFLDLDNGYQYAVRGSGTEPKIKFYLFAREDVSEPGELDAAKERARATAQALAEAIDADARSRVEGGQ